MSGLQDLLEAYGNMDPDEVLRASLQEGVRMFSTTAGATTPEDEVPINPLPDQVNENGSDPEETDSDLAGDDNDQEEAEEDEPDESEYDEDEQQSPKTPSRSASKNKASRKGSKAAAATSSSKNEALATAVSARARLPSCAMGIVELLTFFPNHTQWPEAGLRAWRNGWKHPDVARIQLNARVTLNRDAFDKRVDSLKHQILTNGRHFFNNQTFKPSTHTHLMTPVTSYDASSYAPRNNQGLYTATLMDIAAGIANWPVGQDRGIVTQAIQYAHNNGFAQYTTADIPRIAQQMDFTAPIEAAGTDWDQNAKGRVTQIAGRVPAKSSR